MSYDPEKHGEYTPPSLRLVKTIGGYYRVELHGPDSLQKEFQRPDVYFMADIARGATKDEALEKAREWFAGMQDDT